MLKKVAVALLCTALGSSLQARDDISMSNTFIGVELGYVEVQGDTFTNLSYTGDYDIEFGLRIGAEKDEWRTTLLFDYYDSADNDQNVEKALMTLDYYLLNNESIFKPYIGVNIGYGNYESTLVEDSGLLYGGQAGIVINAAEMINLDVSYRHSLSGTDVFDHIGGVTFALDYLF